MIDIPLTNREATSTLLVGNVVVWDTANDRSVTLTTTGASTLVAGVVVGNTVPPTTVGLIRVFGPADIRVGHSVTRGQYLGTSSTSGLAGTITPATGNVLGIALTSGTGTQKGLITRM